MGIRMKWCDKKKEFIEIDDEVLPIFYSLPEDIQAQLDGFISDLWRLDNFLVSNLSVEARLYNHDGVIEQKKVVTDVEYYEFMKKFAATKPLHEVINSVFDLDADECPASTIGDFFGRLIKTFANYGYRIKHANEKRLKNKDSDNVRTRHYTMTDKVAHKEAIVKDILKIVTEESFDIWPQIGPKADPHHGFDMLRNRLMERLQDYADKY